MRAGMDAALRGVPRIVTAVEDLFSNPAVGGPWRVQAAPLSLRRDPNRLLIENGPANIPAVGIRQAVICYVDSRPAVHSVPTCQTISCGLGTSE
jgi:hypothetical protein